MFDYVIIIVVMIYEGCGIVNKVIDKESTRNYGVDLLRIFSMFLIVMLHSLGKGGIIHNVVSSSLQYKFAWMMEIIAYPAVNIFALTSGYVSYSNEEKKHNYTNYILLWLEVVFYGIFITLIFDLIDPSSITIIDYLITMFPITNGLYWYFTAYTALFFFIPFINNAIRNTNDKNLKYMIGVIIVIFTFFDNIANRFILGNGYSFIWLLLLYILGAIIKKCGIDKKIKNYKIICGIIIFYIITYLYKMYGLEYQMYDFKYAIWDVTITKDLFVSYTSPTILMVAILYLIGFSRIKFSTSFTKIIKFSSSASFAIYILNNHRLIWTFIISNLFLPLTNNLAKVIVYPIIFSLGFVIVAILIDKLRQLLFKWLHIKEIIIKILSIICKN